MEIGAFFKICPLFKHVKIEVNNVLEKNNSFMNFTPNRIYHQEVGLFLKTTRAILEICSSKYSFIKYKFEFWILSLLRDKNLTQSLVFRVELMVFS